MREKGNEKKNEANIRKRIKTTERRERIIEETIIEEDSNFEGRKEKKYFETADDIQ